MITSISQAIDILAKDYDISVEVLQNDMYRVSDDDGDWDNDFFYGEDELIDYVNELEENNL